MIVSTFLLPPACVILLLLYAIITWRYDYFKKRGVPFSNPIPIIGNMEKVICRRLSFGENLIDIYNKFKGHGLAGYFEFLTPVTMIRDPEIIRRVGVKDFDYFTDHRTGIRIDVDPLFGRNIFALHGQRWREMRYTLSPAFTSKKMRSMFSLMIQAGDQLGEYLEKKCRGSADGLFTLEMKDLFTRYANDVIATTTFGLQCDSLEEPDNEFYRIGTRVSDFSGIQGLKFLGFLFSARLMKLFKITMVSPVCGNFFRKLIHSTIKMREKLGIVRPDMIHLLMQAQRGTLKHDVTDEGTEGVTEEIGRKKTVLTDDDITANALLFFLAGFDSSSTLMCFMSHLLAIHPHMQRRVQREMDEVLRESGGIITYDGIQKMRYLDMVISESMRLYPPAVFTDRKCVKPYVIEETASSPRVPLDAGDGISIPIFALHRDPDHFPEPEKFDPERFSEENKHKIKPFTYLPFGVGPRNCIGQRFALMETKVAFTCLLTRFDLELVARTTVPIVMLRSSLNMGSQGGFWLGVRPRTKSSI